MYYSTFFRFCKRFRENYNARKSRSFRYGFLLCFDLIDFSIGNLLDPLAGSEMADAHNTFQTVLRDKHYGEKNDEILGAEEKPCDQHGRDAHSVQGNQLKDAPDLGVATRAEDAAHLRVRDHTDRQPATVEEETSGGYLARVLGRVREESKDWLAYQDQHRAEDHAHNGEM